MVPVQLYLLFFFEIHSKISIRIDEFYCSLRGFTKIILQTQTEHT